MTAEGDGPYSREQCSEDLHAGARFSDCGGKTCDDRDGSGSDRIGDRGKFYSRPGRGLRPGNGGESDSEAQCNEENTQYSSHQDQVYVGEGRIELEVMCDKILPGRTLVSCRVPSRPN
jgi:hypothetical protein